MCLLKYHIEADTFYWVEFASCFFLFVCLFDYLYQDTSSHNLNMFGELKPTLLISTIR